MEKQRHNSFNQIHKGLRIMMYDTSAKLQQTDLSDAIVAKETISQLEEVLYLFESHAHGEDTFFNGPLQQTDPAVANLFEKEHEEDHRLGVIIQDLIEQWKSESTLQGRAAAGRKLMYAFNEFIAFNLYHMNKEEIELNAVLWNRYTDDEIRAIEQTLVQQIPPQKMALYAKWMVRGINDVELAHWLAEVKVGAPAEVFGMLLGIAKAELSSERFSRIQKKMDTKLAVA